MASCIGIVLLFTFLGAAFGTTGADYSFSPLTHGACSSAFGFPIRSDCEAAIRDIPVDNFAYRYTRFVGKRFSSSYLENGLYAMTNARRVELPIYWRSGTCVISLYLPADTVDDTTWELVRTSAKFIVGQCIDLLPGIGGFQYIGLNRGIQLVVYRPPGPIANDNHEISLKAKEINYQSGYYTPGFRLSGKEGQGGYTTYSDQSPIPNYKRCRWESRCNGWGQCGSGCDCIAKSMRYASLASFVAYCGSVVSAKSALLPRDLDSTEAESIACLCNSSFAHPECCSGGKFRPDTYSL